MIITTKHLILSPVTDKDYDIYTHILGSNTLTQYLPKGRAYTKDEIAFHLKERVRHWEHGFGSYVICLKSQPEAKIGYVGVEQCTDTRFSDIRYGLLTQYHGCGFAYEAARAVLRETFKANKHSKIYGVALKDNVPSLTIIKKLGMKPEPETQLYGDVDILETYAIEKFV